MTGRRIRKAFGGLALLLVALAGIALIVAMIQGRRTPGGRPDYVALGSSFAAGAGLGPLQPGSPWLCARSVDGYPQQLARLRGLAIVDMSCGGAVTAQVLHGGQFFQGPQIRTITADTRLVTITVGGNDVGYIGDLSLQAARNSGSLFGRLVALFWGGPKTPAERHYDALRDTLTATLRDVRARAPKAVIVVATYPTILPPSGTCPLLGLSAAQAAAMRQVGDTLAAVTRSVAQAQGAIVVDMHRLGADHHACAAAPWTRGWTNGAIAPFHPTLAGAQATAAAISRAIGPLPAAPQP